MSLAEITALVDMDGVQADFEGPNHDIIRARFPDVAIVEDRDDFYLTETYRRYPGVNDALYTGCREPGFFTTFPLIDGAILGWQRILEAGFRPRICSSPLENHPTAIEEKKAWLEEHFVPVFGMWVVDTAIFDRDKSKYDAAALFDDHPKVRNADRAYWQQIMVSHSYNRSVETDFRLEDWYDPRLEELLARARQQYRQARQASPLAS